jgi:probable F420-dependent oxidoreductase
MFGVQDVFGGDPQSLLMIAREADRIGIDQIVFTDHVIMGTRTDRYPFGDFPVPPEYPWYEPMTLMAAVAGCTGRIRLATGVLIAPLRPAALLAKMAATLDVLSNGRLDLGVGVGWQREEYEAQGQDFESRWAALDDQLRIMKALWSDAPATVHTKTADIEGLYSLPLPRQAGGVPLWFGVAPTARQARRVAEFGHGWIPIRTNPPFIREGVQLFREAFEAVGRDPDSVQVRAHAQIDYQADGKAELAKTLDSVAAIVEAGATVIEIESQPFLRKPDELMPFLETLMKLKPV